MKYLLFDTNILIDMIIDRKNNVSKKLVESFLKLLEFDEIKLIIPSIVIYETNKHLEEQLSEVGKKIEYAIKSIDEIYGINGYKIQDLEVKLYKKHSKSELNTLLASYNSSKKDYFKEIRLIIDNLFKHRNCIIVLDDAELRSSCLQRRIYKKAPFHREKKESYADGLIIETLLNINNMVEIASDDEIILVSGNTSDFSDKDKKSQLHKDILCDLEIVGLKENTKYVLHFCELVGDILKNEVEQANLKEEFEQGLHEEEEYERELLDDEIDDNERESVGLTSLSNFKEMFLENFRSSKLSQSIIELFERLNTCYSTLEELYFCYSDEISAYIKSVEHDKITDFMEKWNTISHQVKGDKVGKNIGGILDILNKIESKAHDCDYSDYGITLPDYLNYGDNIIFYCKDKNKFELVMAPLYLSCDNGGMDWLDIELFGHDRTIEAKGSIEITYGYMDITDDGNIGDGYSEGISYNTEQIIMRMDELISDFEEYITSERLNVELIKEEFDI